MEIRLTGPLGRIAALGLLVAVAGAAYTLAVAWPLARQEAMAQEIFDLRHALARYRAIAAEAPGIRRAAEAQGRQSEENALYLQGSTDALAAAQLVEQLKQVVQESRGRVSAAQNLPAEAADGLQKVTVRIQFAGPIETVQRVLHTVETGRPLLFVDGFEIRETARSQYGADDSGRDPVLGVRLDISGYLRAGTG
jgi:general secretion pathway protein M